MWIVKLARRLYFLIAFNFYAKPRITRTDYVTLLGCSLEIPPTTFHPGLYFSSKYLGEYVQTLNLHNIKVLDVGCGSGILSLVAALRGASVTGVDINPKAVAATTENAKRNALASLVSARVGDLFGALAVDEQFDIILFNPPFYDGEPGDDSDRAWRGGENYQVIRRFAHSAPAFLTGNGKII